MLSDEVRELENRIETLEDERNDLALDLEQAKADLRMIEEDQAEELTRLRETIRELLDRLADHRTGIIELDEVLTGPMMREVFDRHNNRAGIPGPHEVWAAARDLDLTP